MHSAAHQQPLPPAVLRMGECHSCLYHHSQSGACSIRQDNAVPLKRPTHCRSYWPSAKGAMTEQAS